MIYWRHMCKIFCGRQGGFRHAVTPAKPGTIEVGTRPNAFRTFPRRGRPRYIRASWPICAPLRQCIEAAPSGGVLLSHLEGSRPLSSLRKQGSLHVKSCFSCVWRVCRGQSRKFEIAIILRCCVRFRRFKMRWKAENEIFPTFFGMWKADTTRQSYDHLKFSIFSDIFMNPQYIFLVIVFFFRWDISLLLLILWWPDGQTNKLGIESGNLTKTIRLQKWFLGNE